MSGLGSIEVARGLTGPPPAERPGLVRGLALRFGLTYWSLIAVFYVGLDSDELSKTMTEAIAWIRNPIMVWIGHAVLGISREMPTETTGSGDRTVDWISVGLFAVVAAVVAAVWAWLDRRRAHDDRVHAIMRVVIRYAVATTLMSFGMAKVFMSQFGDPPPGRLLQAFGDATPMGLMWTFIGASPPYQVFGGVFEVLGAALLLSRRTATLGALVLATVLANVAMLNLCYDVCVKLASSLYFVMCTVLIAPELGRLGRAMLTRRAVPPAPVPASWWAARPRRRVARYVLKYGYIAFLMYSVVTSSLRAHAYVLELREPPGGHWYDGAWRVVSFVIDGEAGPAIASRDLRWDRIRIDAADHGDVLRWHFADDSRGDLYAVAVDEAAGTLSLTPTAEVRRPTGPVVLHFVRLDADHLALDGKVGARQLHLQVERFKAEAARLMSQPFHLISERPIND